MQRIAHPRARQLSPQQMSFVGGYQAAHLQFKGILEQLDHHCVAACRKETGVYRGRDLTRCRWLRSPSPLQQSPPSPLQQPTAAAGTAGTAPRSAGVRHGLSRPLVRLLT